MKIISLNRALGSLSLVFAAACTAADNAYRAISIGEFADAIKHWNDRTSETASAHDSLTPIPQIADNTLRYLRADGGLLCNKYLTRILSIRELQTLAAEKNLPDSSFNNRYIYPQINDLTQDNAQPVDSRYQDGALRGIDYIQKKQTKNVGWTHTSTRYPYHAADYDIKIIAKKDASPLWKMFSGLHTQQRFFANCDAKKFFDLNDLHHEGRTGYAGYDTWPSKLLTTTYPAWQVKNAI
jgi:hypothetical protein